MLNELPVTIRGYTFLRIIGKGGFSSVYLVESARFKQLFCAKVINVSTNSNEIDSQWKTFDQEVQILSQLNHPHVIRIYDHFSEKNNFFIVLEFCMGGSLSDVIKKHKALTIDKFAIYGKQVVTALALCHARGIAHHDLKLANVLLDEYGRAKLADFGISIKSSIGTLCESYAGSTNYESPEIVQKVPHDPFKADIWALGVMFCYMITGNSPWRCDTIGQLKKLINAGKYYLPRNTDPIIADMVSKMLVVNPEERISIDELARNPLFLDAKWVNDRCSVSDPLSPRGREFFPKPISLTQKDDTTERDLEFEEEVTCVMQSKALSIYGLNMLHGRTGLPRIKTRVHICKDTFVLN